MQLQLKNVGRFLRRVMQGMRSLTSEAANIEEIV
jgi:hypothetical protein